MMGMNEAAWRDQVAKVLKGAPFETLVSRSAEGIEIQPLYPKAETAGERALRQDGSRPWRIAQRVDHPDAVAASELAGADLLGGADELRIVFQGAASARGFGIAPRDLATALTGVEIDLVRLSLDLPADQTASDAAIEAMRALVRRERQVPASLDIAFSLDPLTVQACTGRPAIDDAALGARARALREEGFASPVLLADGRIHHDSGATSAEELAAVLSAATSYLRILEGAGVALDEAASTIAFLLVADQDQFWTIAKFRALRRLWGGVQRHCGLDPAPARIAAETSFRMCARRDPAVNFLRSTTAAFAAAAGGADSISVLPYTIALGLPDGFARRMARNAQGILIEESHLAQVLDPGAGSLFQEIEAAGGLGAMLGSGSWQARMREAAAARAASIASGDAPILGVTLYPDARERPVAVLMDAPLENEDGRHPLALVTQRDAAAFEAALSGEGKGDGK